MSLALSPVLWRQKDGWIIGKTCTQGPTKRVTQTVSCLSLRCESCLTGNAAGQFIFLRKRYREGSWILRFHWLIDSPTCWLTNLSSPTGISLYCSFISFVIWYRQKDRNYTFSLPCVKPSKDQHWGWSVDLKFLFISSLCFSLKVTGVAEAVCYFHSIHWY